MPSENLGVWGRAPGLFFFHPWAPVTVVETTGAAPISREGGCEELPGPCELQLCAGLAAPVVRLFSSDKSRLAKSPCGRLDR
jgi:hypothetical protein